jgi:hypothetical protein
MHSLSFQGGLQEARNQSRADHHIRLMADNYALAVGCCSNLNAGV